MNYSILDTISEPKHIKHLNKEQLERLSLEIRDFLIRSVSKTGGHLASNLGVVELTLALHRVYNTPDDKLIWDVSHQSYVHKILTGRKKEFDTLRQLGGLSGYSKRSESSHDAFEAGHSSTSISAAIGMCKARDFLSESHEICAILGDGALTGGMAFEALNAAGHSKDNLIVVLNDNEMSIGENVGGVSKYLRDLRTTSTYNHAKEKMHSVIDPIPVIGENISKGLHKLKSSVKYMVLPGLLFEEMGFTYIGPIDGHNVQSIENALQRAKQIPGPKLVHVKTIKGKGYIPAETNPDLYHGVSPFDHRSGIQANNKETYSKVFGNSLVEMAKTNDSFVAITAAMTSGTGLTAFKDAYPERLIDAGIAEQHAVTMAAGLAASGIRPFFAVYSTFLQRGYDQVLHDVCIQNLPVVFCLDRAGVVGNDGETHHGIFDLSFLMHLPNMMIMAPKDKNELVKMLEYAQDAPGPLAIRYPRGQAINMAPCIGNLTSFESLYDGQETVIIATGNMVEKADKVVKRLKSEGLDPALINARLLKPFDFDRFKKAFPSAKNIVTIEDNVLIGGFGSYVRQHFDHHVKVDSFGYPDQFIPHGSIDELHKIYGLDEESLYDSIKAIMEVES